MLLPIETRLKHRDLNWLSFNGRVLQEATDKINPLYERIKFLAIFSSNLDEYFQVRVSQLRQIKRVEKSIRKKLALRPNKTTRLILEEVKVQQQKFGEIIRTQIIPELAENGIFLIDAAHFNSIQIQCAQEYFKKDIAPHLKTIKIDLSDTPELFLENNVLYFAISFKNKEHLGLINIPTEACGRFVLLEEKVITYLDDIIRNEIPSLFPEEVISGVYEIKLSRDAELYIDDEFDGVLAEKIYESLAQRTDGQATRLLYDASMPGDTQKKLRKLLKLGEIDMMPGGEYHNFSDFFSFPDPTNNPELHFEIVPPVKHRLLEDAKDYFSVISKKDQSLHFVQ